MNTSLQKLRSDLGSIKALLDQGALYSITPDEKQRLLEGTQELARKLDDVENGFLTVGLLGGTGVGKSTLMNALAGEKIASASHRRPHTDRILIYRHRDAPLPSLHMEDLPWRDIIHKGAAIRQILLCDLPDFDSIIGEHRKGVLQFLEHLDLLVWVTSPEKYADGRFYEFLSATAKAPGNFLFVLNKMDLLFQGDTQEKAYSQMNLLVNRFREYLHKNGMEGPTIYPISAQEVAGEGVSPWNQLSSFRQHLFRQRDMKQIRVIKAANLDMEIRDLFATLHKEIQNLETFKGIIGNLGKDLEETYSQWVDAGRQSIGIQVRKQITPEILFHQHNSYPLAGPGLGIALLLQVFRAESSKPRLVGTSPLSSTLPKEIAMDFKKRLAGIEVRTDRILLGHGLPSPFREQIKRTLDPTVRAERLIDGLTQVTLSLAVDPPRPPFRGFKVFQWFSYFLLLSLFLFAIGGDAWKVLMDNPSPASAVGLLARAVRTLFSSQGLAALSSYVLLNLFLAFRFYTRYTRLLRRSVERLRESVEKGLLKVWEDETKGLLENVATLMGETTERHSSLVSMR